MKKILSLVLVLSMVLGSFGFAFAAPADVEGTEYEEAVKRLMAVGIINGYEDGTIRPDNTITRAEFAAIVVRSLGLEAAAIKGATPFSDVEAGNWASGYINVAAGLGVVNGMGDGTFAPSAPVTFEQAVTMVVRALGYEAAAQAKGGYPGGYLVVAAQEDITDDVDGTVGSAAVRGVVFQLVDNSLEIPMMIQTGYGSDARYIKSGTEGTEEQSILENKLNVTKVNERVVEIPRTDSSLEDNEIELETTGAIEVVEGFNFEGVYGAELKAYINSDDLLVDYVVNDTVEYDALTSVSDTEAKLVDADEEYDFASDVEVYVDGSSKSVSSLSTSYAFAKVVLNGDDEIVFIDAYTLDDYVVVKDVDGDYVVGYDEELKVKDYTIIKDGKTIEVADIEAGDILFYDNAADYAEVFNKATAGEIEKVFSGSFEVDGEEFDTAGKYLDGDSLVAVDEDALDSMKDNGDVTVFVNRAGDVVYVTGDLGEVTTSTIVGYLTSNVAVYQDVRNAKDFFAIDMINGNGEEVSYDLKAIDLDEIDLVKAWADANDTTPAIGSDKVWADATGSEKDTITEYYLANVYAPVAKDQLIELSVDEDGAVTKIAFNLTSTSLSADTKTDAKYIEGKKAINGAIVFDATEYAGDAGDMVVTTWDKIEFSELKSGAPGVEVYHDSKNVEYLIVNNSDRDDENVEEHLALITDVKVLNGGGEWRVKAYVDGELMTFYTDKHITDVTAVAGQIAKIFVDTNTDELTKKSGVTTVDPVVVTETDQDATAVSIVDKELTVNGSDYELVSDGYVFDITGSDITEISLRDIEVGAGKDRVTVIVDETGTTFTKYILLTHDASEGTTTTPITDITITLAKAIFVDNADFVGTANNAKVAVDASDVNNVSWIIYDNDGSVVKAATITAADTDVSGSMGATVLSAGQYTIKVVNNTDGSVIETATFTVLQ